MTPERQAKPHAADPAARDGSLSDGRVGDGIGLFLRPRSVAVVGASDDPGRVGGMPLHFLRAAGFAGPVYPINPRRSSVQGELSCPDIASVPETIDLAVVAVPADSVVATVEECAEAGVRAAVVFSSGFAETDARGEKRQRELADVVRRTGIRVCGPNCAGTMNTSARLTASFGSHLAADATLLPGTISVVSQSGAVGAYLFTLARKRGIGLASWVTTGNEVDATVADFMDVIARDDETRVIVLYLEQVREVDTLMRACAVARARGKRIVGVLAGRTDASAEALRSHTASLAGDRDIASAALCELGVELVDSLDDLLSSAIAMSRERQPATEGLGIITISGAAGIMTVDRAAEQGLSVPTLPSAVQEEMRALLPYAGTANPVDVTGNISNRPEIFRPFLDALLDDDRVGGVVCFLGHVLLSPHVGERLRQDVTAAAQRSEKPIWLVGVVSDEQSAAELDAVGVELVTDPVQAVDLHALNVRAALRSVDGEQIIDRRRQLAEVRLLDLPEGVVLSEIDAQRVFRRLGIRCPGQFVATSGAEAAEAAARIPGSRVVMKVVSADIQHKSDAGAVRIGVEPAHAASVYADIVTAAREHAPDATIDGVVVQELVEGHPVIVGTKNDPAFGPVVLVGSGGIYTELLQDTALALAPVDRRGAERLVAATSLGEFLAGARGGPALATDALVDVIVKVSELAWQARGQISSLELNPVLVSEHHATAADALIETKGIRVNG